MTYEELIGLMDSIRGYIHMINDIDKKIKSLQNYEDVSKIYVNMITINGKDYFIRVRNTDNDSNLEFSKFIYDSLVSYFENEREKLYKEYTDKMTELKSITKDDIVIDFSDEIKCLKI